MSTYICKHCLLLSWDFHDITVSHTKTTHTYTLFWTDTWISPKSTCTQQLCMLLMCEWFNTWHHLVAVDIWPAQWSQQLRLGLNHHLSIDKVLQTHHRWTFSSLKRYRPLSDCKVFIASTYATRRTGPHDRVGTEQEFYDMGRERLKIPFGGSTLTLLAGWENAHPACKILVPHFHERSLLQQRKPKETG